MPGPSNDHPLSGKRILLVEDEFLISLDIQSILETGGASHVSVVSRVAEALSVLAGGNTFDAAVLDLKLGKDSTGPVAERLNALKIPFIVLTGAPNEAKRLHPTVQVVDKPFHSKSLLAALSNAMSAKS